MVALKMLRLGIKMSLKKHENLTCRSLGYKCLRLRLLFRSLCPGRLPRTFHFGNDQVRPAPRGSTLIAGAHYRNITHISGVPTFALPQIPDILELALAGEECGSAEQLCQTFLPPLPPLRPHLSRSWDSCHLLFIARDIKRGVRCSASAVVPRKPKAVSTCWSEE